MIYAIMTALRVIMKNAKTQILIMTMIITITNA